jgi:hypothetical protein
VSTGHRKIAAVLRNLNSEEVKARDKLREEVLDCLAYAIGYDDDTSAHTAMPKAVALLARYDATMARGRGRRR